jgi:hypothetical protein
MSCLAFGHARIVDAADHVRRDERREDAENHYDDHDLDQREAAVAVRRWVLAAVRRYVALESLEKLHLYDR